MFVEALAQTRDGSPVNFEEIATRCRTTASLVRATLKTAIPEVVSGEGLSASARFQLAFLAGRNGLFLKAAEALTWQEFETFAIECLKLAGFETSKGIIAHGQGRKWQIDLTGKKGSMLLALDCKHWHSGYSAGRMSDAARHQKKAVCSMLQDVKCRKMFRDQRLSVLPIILTLLEPHERVINGAVLVSLEKFSDFLNGVNPFLTDLPFIESDLISERAIS